MQCRDDVAKLLRRKKLARGGERGRRDTGRNAPAVVCGSADYSVDPVRACRIGEARSVLVEARPKFPGTFASVFCPRAEIAKRGRIWRTFLSRETRQIDAEI